MRKVQECFHCEGEGKVTICHERDSSSDYQTTCPVCKGSKIVFDEDELLADASKGVVNSFSALVSHLVAAGSDQTPRRTRLEESLSTALVIWVKALPKPDKRKFE